MKVCLKCGLRFNNSGWECPVCHTVPEISEGYLTFSPALAKNNESFKAGSFDKLFELEAGNFWFRARNRLIIWALQNYFPEARSFFEIGCGTGFVLSGIERRLPQLELFGSEIYSAGLSYAAKRLKSVLLFQMDARAIPFDDEFDIIGAFDVLEHIREDELVLRQMYQAVRQGGGIIISVPQHNFLWSQVDEYACHVRRYNATELKEKVTLAGFHVVKMTSFVSLLLPLMLVSRFRKRKPDNEFDATSELRLAGLTNTIMEGILDFERGLINMGLAFPAGGSLLLIAKKM